MLTYAALYLGFTTVVFLNKLTKIKTGYDLSVAIIIISSNAFAFYAVGHTLGWF